MCCVFSTLVLFGPRLGILVWWLFWPARFRLVFQGSWLWPLLGLLFLPWTTLMYLVVGPQGVNGLDWLWLGLGLLADLASYSGGAYGNRDRLRG
jgi:hypothetical protein